MIKNRRIYDLLIDETQGEAWLDKYKQEFYEACSFMPEGFFKILIEHKTKFCLYTRETTKPIHGHPPSDFVGVDGKTYLSEGLIVLRLNRVSDNVYHNRHDVIFHESAHIFDNYITESLRPPGDRLRHSNTKAWVALYREEKDYCPDSHARSNSSEYFASAIAMYLMRRSRGIGEANQEYIDKYFDNISKTLISTKNLLATKPRMRLDIDSLIKDKIERIAVNNATNSILYYRDGVEQEVPLPPQTGGGTGGGDGNIRFNNNVNFDTPPGSNLFSNGTITYSVIKGTFNEAKPFNYILVTMRHSYDNVIQIRYPFYGSCGSGTPTVLKQEVRMWDPNHSIEYAPNQWSKWYTLSEWNPVALPSSADNLNEIKNFKDEILSEISSLKKENESLKKEIELLKK